LDKADAGEDEDVEVNEEEEGDHAEEDLELSYLLVGLGRRDPVDYPVLLDFLGDALVDSADHEEEDEQLEELDEGVEDPEGRGGHLVLDVEVALEVLL